MLKFNSINLAILSQVAQCSMKLCLLFFILFRVKVDLNVETAPAVISSGRCYVSTLFGRVLSEVQCHATVRVKLISDL